MKYIKLFIKEHGIDCWLHIRTQVKRQYGRNARILYYNSHLSYFQWECAMSDWFEL